MLFESQQLLLPVLEANILGKRELLKQSVALTERTMVLAISTDRLLLPMRLLWRLVNMSIPMRKVRITAMFSFDFDDV